MEEQWINQPSGEVDPPTDSGELGIEDGREPAGGLGLAISRRELAISLGVAASALVLTKTDYLKPALETFRLSTAYAAVSPGPPTEPVEEPGIGGPGEAPLLPAQLPQAGDGGCSEGGCEEP